MLCFRCGSYNPENAQKCSVCGQGFVDEAGKPVGPPRRPSQTAQPASIFVPGELVAGRYRIGELLGQGGVGAVYRARDLEIDVDVALKAITSNLLQTDEEQKNFSKQIKAARKLQHPNIVRIYDEGHEGNRRFFTMKLLEGLTLRKIIRLRHEKGQPFTAEELVPIFHQLAAALDYAHKSTWHGDLKPENILILPDLLKVTDFHLVRALPLKPFLGIAKSKNKGFAYIAPELRVEAQTIDGRVDIYALGVILCEMLTGLTYEGHYSRAVTAALEQLPTKLDGLVRKALTEHPDGRFARAGDLARDLEQGLGAMQGPLPPPVKPPQAGDAPKPALAKPPPPPAETGPGLSPVPALSSSDPDTTGPPPPLGDDSREPSEVVEIGQSQVVLLQSGITQQPLDLNAASLRSDATPSSGELAEAARRLMNISGSNPEDTLDEAVGAASDIPTAPRGAPVPKASPLVGLPREGLVSTGERPHDADKLVEALYSDEKDESLIPPPLPEENENSLDKPVKLPGDDDDDDEEETGERPPSPRISAKEGEIHDALTALKNHPPELMDEGPREEAIKAIEAEKSASKPRPKPGAGAKNGEVSSSRPRPPPQAPIDNDDSLKDTLSADVLKAARERSSPALHASEPLPPPVVAPPPVLRPVTPPSRPSSGPPPMLIAFAGIAAVVVAVLVGKFVIFTDEKPRDTDRALVTPGDPDPTPPPPPEPTPTITPDDAKPLDVKPLPVDTKPIETKPTESKPEETKPVVVETKPVETKPADTKPADAKPADTKPDETKPVETKPVETKPIEVAAVTPPPMSCPKGMAFIESGAFTFGSAGSDPMKNFGEAEAQSAQVNGFCVDYYEHPNGKDTLPTTGVSWSAAKSACERGGKRLCTEKEWERACKGPGSSRFPYGDLYDAEICNTEDAEGKARSLATATAFKKCRSGFKVFMMAGNAEEWVLDSNGDQRIAKGGAADRPDFASRCSARRSMKASTKSPTLGFRCCADPR